MSIDSLTLAATDRAFIDGTEEVELNDWSNRFGVTREQLRTAMAAVGARVTDVEAYLASHVTVTA
jgi:predicted metalloprotease with PDZ domain